MQLNSISFILIAFLIMTPATSARAENAIPDFLSDEALTSYISGQIALTLNGMDYNVSQTCDATGCSVVVQ